MDTSAESPRRGLSRRPLLVCSGLVAAGWILLLAATSPGLPMVWDEGSAISRAEGITRWAGRWVQARGPRPWSREAIDGDWAFTTRIEGHPAFFGIVIAAGQWLAAGWLPPLGAARFGPILLFGMAAGAMFYRMARQSSGIAAGGAVVALILLPRLFAHAHFALCDGTLTACWILAWATFAPACRKWRWTAVWGIALGMTLSAKATGWLAPLPFLVWAVLYQDRRAVGATCLGTLVALVTFLVLNPPLWHQPLEGLATFVQLNTGRGANPGLNISTWFLGRMYNLDFPLPWYNTLLWTVVTVPVGILFLAAAGLWRLVKDSPYPRPGMLLVGHWIVLLVVRALPFAPPHDGVRLFLPSFAFLAALAGLGADGVYRWAIGRRLARRTAGLVGLAAIYLGSATSLAWYAPQWLSYYNLLIGGLPGATRLGMEPTYYWDGLDRPVLDWLDQHTAPREKILFGPVVQKHVQAGPVQNLAWMRRWGVFRHQFAFPAPGQYRWYVLQRRPSGMWPADHWLVQNRRPAFRKTIRRGGWGPWRLAVPLVDVYQYGDFLEATRAVAR